MFDDAVKLLDPEALGAEQVEHLLTEVGFNDWQATHRRLTEFCANPECRTHLTDFLPMLLTALSETANPDGSLVNFERFVQAVDQPARLFRYLCENPRAVEILVKLFVGSQFLTETLLRHPEYLNDLAQHRRLAEFKSREDFCEDAAEALREHPQLEDRFDAVRRFQRWELLRIGACDSFGLMDLKSVTVQLSLLADSIVQTCLSELRTELRVPAEDFAVVAFGKLGGEELNYSSDIDLVFVARDTATQFWPLGQRLVNVLTRSTAEGFLYRTDLRLRPWGRSGPLVVSCDAYVDYLNKNAMLWEKQALLKARVIAGDFEAGQQFLKQAESHIFGESIDSIRQNIQEMKGRIESELQRKGRAWGEVKSGEGSIRDIEFVTQFLQLAHGGRHPEIRSFNTLDALVRLADFGFLQADEFRQLSTGYVFLRTVEHALQLMHNKQTHSLPEDRRELAYLARRLDFPGTDHFLEHYDEYCSSIRSIYKKYIEESERPARAPSDSGSESPAVIEGMEPSYSQSFSPEEIARHRQLLDRLDDENIVEVETTVVADEFHRVTIVGFDRIGDLSMICGLLFVYGFDIVDGNVFTAEQVCDPVDSGKAKGRAKRRPPARKFVDVFTVRTQRGLLPDEVWGRYRQDLDELMKLSQAGSLRDAQGQLAKRVPLALRQLPELPPTLYPVEVSIDNEVSPRCTVLDIRSEDTPGFLYELTNSLALVGINIIRVTVGSSGDRVSDILYVTDEAGRKITDEAKQHELRAAVVLIKHFTHLLPHSPNPESALLHFKDFVEQLFQQTNWPERISSLQRLDVLEGLARLLGVSPFLWEDFLRLQHANLFPVVADIEALEHRKSREELESEIRDNLAAATDFASLRKALNAFKDREMFRVDMRHIRGQIEKFGVFSDELCDVAEVTVSAACGICRRELESRFGSPCLDDGRPCSMCVAALGKCGGRELGFASDIELMFLYEGAGHTTGPERITNAEFFTKLVEMFMQTVEARRAGIFHIDLRLRPYGRAGSLAVSSDAFASYFALDGPAWPYERQSLVKLRPIAGDVGFGERVVELRDSLVYCAKAFDVSAMRAMREKQVRQLVQPGTFNVKLSHGGLVDCEYLVQGLQMSHGHRNAALRATNTIEAIEALEADGILGAAECGQLRRAYVFQRNLIDALRMVRGDARDLTIPESDSEAFEFLARRVGYGDNSSRLRKELEEVSQHVVELGRLLDRPADSRSTA